MYTYNRNADGTYTVGRLERRRVGEFEMDEFVPMGDVNCEDDAARVINYLHGGYGHLPPISFRMSL